MELLATLIIPARSIFTTCWIDKLPSSYVLILYWFIILIRQLQFTSFSYVRQREISRRELDLSNCTCALLWEKWATVMVRVFYYTFVLPSLFTLFPLCYDFLLSLFLFSSFWILSFYIQLYFQDLNGSRNFCNHTLVRECPSLIYFNFRSKCIIMAKNIPR